MEHKNPHVNSSFRTNKKHTENSDNPADFTTEGEHISASALSEISSIKFSGCVNNSDNSVATSILDFEDLDGNSLKQKVEDSEYQVKYLEIENKQINEELQLERKKNVKLEKKLQFVKENQEVFMRLKEAYINMKYNEAAGRKMIEIRERGIQTWEGTLCGACIESEELRREFQLVTQKYNNLFIVSPSEMERLINTVKYLKDLINRREETWAYNFDRDRKFQTQIAILESENIKLRENISKKENNEDISKEVFDDVQLDKKLLEERRIEEMQKVIEGLTKDLEKLKKIIIKYEKNFRDIKDYHPGKHISPLNDKEIKIVQQIILKYNAKVQKLDQASRSRSPSAGCDFKAPKPQSRRPASPLRGIRIANRECSYRLGTSTERPISPRHNESGNDSAILMMDYLFE